MLLGGFGFLSRLHGLSIDNLVEVEMVLADGRIVVVNENDHPGIASVASQLRQNSNLATIQIYGGLFEAPDHALALQLGTRPKRSQFLSSLRAILSSTSISIIHCRMNIC